MLLTFSDYKVQNYNYTQYINLILSWQVLVSLSVIIGGTLIYKMKIYLSIRKAISLHDEESLNTQLKKYLNYL
jgi:hypothetical protein